MFCFKCKNEWNCEQFLLAGDTFMPEMHLKQRGFTCSACGPFTKTKEELKSLCRLGMSLISLVFSITWLKAKQDT